MLQHQERLFLRRIRVVHRRQPDQRQVGHTGRLDRRLRGVEHNPAGHAPGPGAVHRGRSGGQVPIGRHHPYEQQRFRWSSASTGRQFIAVVVGGRAGVTGRWLLQHSLRTVLLERLQNCGRPAVASTAAAAATRVQPEPLVRPAAERVADKQSQNDAGQHVRQTPTPAVSGRLLFAADHRGVPKFLGERFVRVLRMLVRTSRRRPAIIVVVVVVGGGRVGHRRIIVCGTPRFHNAPTRTVFIWRRRGKKNSSWGRKKKKTTIL